jgi:hypothetical protein
MFTKQRDMFLASSRTKDTIDTLTIGIVVDTNDPQQMGRVRAVCPQWGDSYNTLIEDLPWASYVSPFGGQVSVGPRGSESDVSEGGISYGMWAIPKVGAQVIVMCVDGDPMLRVFMGCIFNQLTPHTLPHGRWMYDSHPGLHPTGASPTPQGPFTSQEHVVEPLTTNLQQAFGGKGDPNYEWRSRASDYSVAGIDVTQLSSTYSGVPDDKNITYEDWSSTQGYAADRTDPHNSSSYTDKNYGSSVYSITSPGFHAFSMDDRQENCRMRFRTTAGHQILLDDTNERIYIATAKGNNWIEMDQDGNIDMYTNNKVSVRGKDINFTADDTIRFHAGKAIHMYSGGDIHTEAVTDIHTKTQQNIRSHAYQGLFLESGQGTDIKATTDLKLTSATAVQVNAGADLKLTSATAVQVNAGADLKLTSATAVQVNAGADLKLTATAGVDVNAGSALKLTASVGVDVNAGADLKLTAGAAASMGASAAVSLSGSAINLNGAPAPTAATAATASSASTAATAAASSELPAFFTSRVPAHEPWARTMTLDDTTLQPEFIYTDANVNRSERGRTITRGTHWRR